MILPEYTWVGGYMSYKSMSRAVSWLGRPARTVLVVATALACAGCGAGTGDLARPLDYSEETIDPAAAALRFAPELYLQRSEPFELVAVVPVLHPSKPLVAYHMFFDDDALLAGRGKELDHEVMWVEYDPVTLKVADVLTLWHRTVLRTELCALDARLREQRPRICVQWGQHGMLPWGWERLTSARPKLELLLHYELASYLNRIPRVSNRKPTVAFDGSYHDYVTFDREVDVSSFIATGDVVVAEYCDEDLESRLDRSFLHKKQWPDW